MLYNFTNKITKQHYLIAGFFIFGLASGLFIERLLLNDKDYLPSNIDNLSSSGNALESAEVKKASADFSSF